MSFKFEIGQTCVYEQRLVETTTGIFWCSDLKRIAQANEEKFCPKKVVIVERVRMLHPQLGGLRFYRYHIFGQSDKPIGWAWESELRAFKDES